MKRIVMGFLTAALVLGAVSTEQTETPAPQTKKKSAAKSTAKTKTATKQPAAAITIPPDAKEFSPGTFRWVDPKDGKAWIYSKTPFGIMRGPETPKEPDPVPADWTITDEGDSLTFERPWPFGGVKRWTKKKSDLTEMEAAVWKRTQEARPAGSSAASSGKN